MDPGACPSREGGGVLNGSDRLLQLVESGHLNGAEYTRVRAFI
jgi:hypothetical protein